MNFKPNATGHKKAIPPSPIVNYPTMAMHGTSTNFDTYEFKCLISITYTLLILIRTFTIRLNNKRNKTVVLLYISLQYINAWTKYTLKTGAVQLDAFQRTARNHSRRTWPVEHQSDFPCQSKKIPLSQQQQPNNNNCLT